LNSWKTKSETPSGLLLLNKRAGLTSFDALKELKQAIASGKVGHTGTLDKFAEGLLLVLTGRALKLSPWFSHCDKRYEGTIRFGIETDTLDPEGQPLAQAPLPSLGEIEAAIPQFTGAIMQAPPAYSAIHINGKRASALARAGQSPAMEKRQVHIYRFELLDWQPPFAHVFVHCSGGTYIRSLARDLALAAGSRAHLSALVRTQVAGFKIKGEMKNEQLAMSNEQRGNEQLTMNNEQRESHNCSLLTAHCSLSPLPITKPILATLGLPWFEIEPEKLVNVIHGKELSPILKGKELVRQGLYMPPGESASEAAGVFCEGELAAIVEKKGGDWKYGYVYANS
jgi:tRNA pseudouridine55 synthase